MYTKQQEDELYFEQFKKEQAYINAEREQYEREFLGEFLSDVSFTRSNKAIEGGRLSVRRHQLESQRSSSGFKIPGRKDIR